MANVIEILISAKDQASKVLDDINDKVSKTKPSFEKSSEASKKFGVAMIGVGAAAIGFGVASAKAFMDSQSAGAQLDAVLKSTGNAAGLSKQQLLDHANALQKVTQYDDEAVQGVESLLLTFTALKGSQVTDATKTVLDMSTALGQDTKSSAIMLGKALQDPIMGVTALKRVGVNFNQTQTDTIKKLVETGNSAQAQALIMKELQTEFGGSAEAAGATFAGKLVILKNAFDDLTKNVGQLIMTALSPMIDGFKSFLETVDEAGGIIPYFTKLINDNQEVLYIAAGVIVGALVPAMIAFAVSTWAAVAPLLPFVAAGALLGIGVKLLVDHFGGLYPVMAKVGEVIKSLSGTFDKVMTVVKPIAIFIKDAFVTAFKALWETIEKNLLPALGKLMPFLKIVGIAVAAIVAINFGIFMATIWLAIQAVRIAIDVVSWLINAIVAMVAWVITSGASIYNAMVATWNAVYAAVSAVFNAIWSFVIKPVIDLIMGYFKVMLAIWTYVFDVIKAVALIAWNWIYSAAIKPVMDAIAAAMNWLGGIIGGVFNRIGGIAGAVWGGISGAARGAWNFITGLWNGAVGFFAGIFGGISSHFSGISDGIKGAFSIGIEGAKGIFKGGANWIIDRINDIIRTINNTAGQLPGVPKIGEIGRLATGTNFAAAGQYLVGEQGAEVVTLPRGAAVSNAKESQRILDTQSNGGGGDIHLHIEYNGRGQFGYEDAVSMAQQMVRVLRAQGLNFNEMQALR